MFKEFSKILGTGLLAAIALMVICFLLDMVFVLPVYALVCALSSSIAYSFGVHCALAAILAAVQLLL